MAKTVLIEPLSLCTAYIRSFAGEHEIGVATGVFWQTEHQVLLVSNWHVFSGRKPGSGQPINSHGAVPDSFRIAFRKNDCQTVFTAHIPLYNTNGEAFWYQDSRVGQDVDLACCLVQAATENSKEFSAINRLPRFDHLRPRVAETVYLLGYPGGIVVEDTLPIWKRGSIASEFDLDLENGPTFMVDSASYSGMSGSPVVMFTRESSFSTEQGGIVTVAGDGLRSKFIGIYSGRFADGSEATQLGLAWRVSAIEAMIKNPAPGTYDLRSIQTSP